MPFQVEHQRCVGCLGCVSACPSNAFLIENATVSITSEFCTSCGICSAFCPTGAIIPSEKATSYVEHLSFDVVISGGGPAGLFCAYHLAKAGFSVVVFERKNEIGSLVACGEAVAKEPFESLISPNPKWVSAPIEGAILRTPSGREIKFNHPNAGYVLERPLFERHLAQIAISEGASIITQACVLDIESEKNLVKAVIAQAPFGKVVCYGKFFIGADGISSHMARFCGASPLGHGEVYVCSQILAYVKSVKPGFVEFIIGSRYAPTGYAWIFPKEGELANVGVGICPALSNRKASELLPEILDARFSSWSVIQCRDGVVPSVRRVKPLGKGNTLLVGDAGRLADPLSGGGIVPALLSAKLASEAIAKHPNSEREIALTHYDKMLQKTLGRRLDFMLRLRNLYTTLSDDELEYASEFLERNFAGKVITGLDTLRVLMDIVRSSPKFMKHWKKFLSL